MQENNLPQRLAARLMLKSNNTSLVVDPVLLSDRRELYFVDLPWPEVACKRKQVRIAE